MRPLALASLVALAAYAARPAPPHPAPDGRADGPVAADAADAAGGAGGAAAWSAPAVRTSVDVRTYAVEGATVDAVHRSMGRGGPTMDGATYFGMTGSEIHVRFRARPDGDGCRLDAVEVDLDVTMTLPEWEARGPTDYALRRDWARFSSALRRHEDGHRRRAEAGARAVAAALAAVRAPTCAAAEAEAGRAVQTAQERTAADQERYDRTTDHGRTEGAAWPVR